MQTSQAKKQKRKTVGEKESKVFLKIKVYCKSSGLNTLMQPVFSHSLNSGLLHSIVLKFYFYRHLHKCSPLCAIECTMKSRGCQCCCPGVNDRQFTHIVAAADVQPCAPWDRVQIQGNGWSKLISGVAIDLTSPQWLTANSTSL